VEDALDRLPSHTDPPSAVSKLDSFRARLHLQDGWRTSNPTDRGFSFLQQSTGVQSRIDRIYASTEIINHATEWNIERTAVSTDHKMVSTCVTNPVSPYIGRGRWTMPLFLLKNKELCQEIQDMGIKLEEKVNNITDRSANVNTQLLFKAFKDEIIEKARD
jgi:hypothetical protein